MVLAKFKAGLVSGAVALVFSLSFAAPVATFAAQSENTTKETIRTDKAEYSLQQDEKSVTLTLANGHFEKRGKVIVAVNTQGNVVDGVQEDRAFDTVIAGNKVTFSPGAYALFQPRVSPKCNALYWGTAAATGVAGLLALPTGGLSLAAAAGWGALIGAGAGGAGISAAAGGGCLRG
ncbi:hypothetical protein ACW5SG_04595 [Lacticaseibacillus paracasei]|uniref:hypothetical protein n=1 Tax=Lacticaseibacillus paracasei TaxID=1597 RepID=UPI000976886C|nr:hypothetical protein [Lacticaseibacillus paracasei]MCB5815982.1 hypothetical protein [Lacticaseibacillus paracasei]MDK6822251.1 hypothetical protein [Lacticaseibacillus paracasei]MDK7799194.1 hypothetical protein [Lacticaseibacillus paracasei]RND96213.1 hypothetical protein FAM19353_01019 [Lacticaseibacillus paracasei]RNE13338.1 hypothetical protein FAM3228_01046 [Lacticaseibacillus paracasei]